MALNSVSASRDSLRMMKGALTNSDIITGGYAPSSTNISGMYPSTICKQPVAKTGTDGSVHNTDPYLADSRSEVWDRFVCPGFCRRLLGNCGSDLLSHRDDRESRIHRQWARDD